MPNHKDWELTELRGEENTKLRAENNELRQIARNSSTFAEENAKLRADIEVLQAAADAERQRASKLADENAAMRADGGLVVHTLDCALQWGEALFAFLPAGSPLTPGVATCKHNLDEAMATLQRMPRLIASAGGQRFGPDEKLKSPHAATPPPELWNALKIAGANIIELTQQRDKLTGVVTAALLLVESLMNQMRIRGVIPDPVVIGAKAKLDQQMRKLLGEGGGRS